MLVLLAIVIVESDVSVAAPANPKAKSLAPLVMPNSTFGTLNRSSQNATANTTSANMTVGTDTSLNKTTSMSKSLSNNSRNNDGLLRTNMTTSGVSTHMLSKNATMNSNHSATDRVNATQQPSTVKFGGPRVNITVSNGTLQYTQLNTTSYRADYLAKKKLRPNNSTMAHNLTVFPANSTAAMANKTLNATHNSTAPAKPKKAPDALDVLKECGANVQKYRIFVHLPVASGYPKDPIPEEVTICSNKKVQEVKDALSKKFKLSDTVDYSFCKELTLSNTRSIHDMKMAFADVVAVYPHAKHQAVTS